MTVHTSRWGAALSPGRWSPAAWGVVAVILGSTALRLWLLAAGPDLDTDAYGHAVIGRFAASDPGNLHIHWVWLPLWHFVFAGLGRIGLGFEAVRTIDVALSALIPWLVFVTVRASHQSVRHADIVALLAALFTAFFPIAITHGQSAEPEALFSVLLLSSALLLERGRRVLCSVPLAFAVLLRFEAWAVLPAFALASVLLGKDGLGATRSSLVSHWLRRLARASLAVLLPGLVIVCYVLAHRAAYEDRWLVFLQENHEFVREARTHAVPGQGPQPVWYWYVASLPYRTAGPVVVLALVGIVRFFRRAPLTYRCVGPWLLAFVTYGWVREQHLGLDRHFFAVVPFYALAMAEGAVLLAEKVRARVPAPAAFRLAVAVPALLLIGFSVHHARAHAAAAELAFPNELRAAAALADGAPEAGSIFCPLVKVEVLSGLRPDRFGTEPAIRERAASGARILVADDVAHRALWPADWRTLIVAGEIMVLTAP